MLNLDPYTKKILLYIRATLEYTEYQHKWPMGYGNLFEVDVEPIELSFFFLERTRFSSLYINKKEMVYLYEWLKFISP